MSATATQGGHNNIPSYPLDNRHYPDVIYWRRGRNRTEIEGCLNALQFTLLQRCYHSMCPAHLVQWSNHLGAMSSRA